MYLVYSKPNCTYCDQAKNLLNVMNLPFEEKIIDIGQEKIDGKEYVTVQQLKEAVPTAMTVPQIFDGEKYIGGFRELKQHLAD
jgi:glutaredoxin